MLDSAAMAKEGALIVIAGVALVFGIIGGVFLVPVVGPVAYFSALFGVIAGLPLSEILYFGAISAVERRAKGRIYVIAEEEMQGGNIVLRKTVEVRPYSG